jgi:DNA-binding GntR family transcriptional regulator
MAEETHLFEEDFSPIEVKVHQILREQILSGELEAGTRLIERDLADKLHISRTPVREALRKLDAEGLIQIIPRKGGVVLEISNEEIIDMFRILECLESLAVRQAAERITPESRKILESVDETTVESMIHAICQVSRNKRLEEMIKGLADVLHATARVGREQPGRATQATAEHREILAAVKQGDGERAAELVHQHINRSVEAYQQQLKKR